MGFAGDIWPVHPSRETVEGYRCYRDVSALPGIPDASFIGVNRHATVGIVDSLSRVGAGGAVCYASGFNEVADGEALNDALLAAAGSMPILGPNCYGLINYLDGALMWPDQHGGERVECGVALFSQSSNIGLNLTMQSRGLPIAYLLALGNQAKTGLADALEAALDDPRVTAVGLYIEGFVDVPAFERAMRRATEQRVPVAALKSGASNQGARITQSHTASMAGSDEAADALFARLGIARVNDLDTLIEVLKLLHVHGPLAGNRLCSMSCSGGEASLMADAVISRDLVFPELNMAQHQAVADTVHELVSVSNPLDYHTFDWNREEELCATYSAMLGCGFDLSLLVLDFPRADRCDLETWGPAVSAIGRAAHDTGVPTAVVASLPESMPESVARQLIADGIVPLCGLRQALDAAQAAATIGAAWQRQLPDTALPGPSRATGHVLTRVDEWQAKVELAQAGLTVPRGQRVRSLKALMAAAQSLDFPLALKVCDADIAHKSEHNAVILNIRDQDALSGYGQDLFARYPQLLVEEMVTDAVCEMIVGVSQDPAIGPWMLLGSGGIQAELAPDRTVVLLPADCAMLERALASLKAYPLLVGFRGTPIADTAALLQALQQVGEFALARKDSLVELELNPLLVRPKGKGVVAVDALLCCAEDA
jgi:acyl-CoA synthetase (NDP forming)